MDAADYLNGIAEVIGELRRYILDALRRDSVDRCEELMAVMDEIYGILVTVDFPEAVTSGLRRSPDAMRGVLERTRGDLTLSLRQRRLEMQPGASGSSVRPDPWQWRPENRAAVNSSFLRRQESRESLILPSPRGRGAGGEGEPPKNFLPTLSHQELPMPEMRITFLGTGAGNCIYRSHTAICLDCPGGDPRSAGHRLRQLDAAKRGPVGLCSPGTITTSCCPTSTTTTWAACLACRRSARHDQPRRGRRCRSTAPSRLCRRVEDLFRATSITHAIDRDGVASAQGSRLVQWTPVQESEPVVLSGGVQASAFPVDHIPGAMGWKVIAGPASPWCFPATPAFVPGWPRKPRARRVNPRSPQPGL